MLPALAALGSGAATGARALGASAGAAGSAGSMYPPLSRLIEYTANKSYPNAIPSPPELIGLLRTLQIPESEFFVAMAKMGIDEAWAKRLFDGSQTILPPDVVVSLNRRGLIDTAEMTRLLKMSGIKEDQMKNLENATRYFPGVDDLIRFVVRDVWSEYKSSLGLGSPPPAKFTEEAKKAGLDPEVAQLYWDAHWELPSLNMGFEMLHRGIIKDPKEIRALIQAHDYNPIWHDKLLQLSYNVMTRVDVRRMYSIGVMNREEVKRQYLNMGYSPEDAEFLTQFTEKNKEDQSNDLSRAAIIRSYTDELISAAEATALLKKIGMNDESISFYLNQADFNKQSEDLQVLVQELTAKWQLGAIDENGIRNALAAEHAPSGFIDSTLARILKQQASKIKIPSRSDLERWFKKGLISEDQYFNGMVRQGYSREDAVLYMSEITQDEEAPQPKPLPFSVYSRWLKAGILSIPEWLAIAKTMRISDADAQRAIQEVQNAAPGN